MTQAIADVVFRRIVVEAPIERAFTVFTDRFGDIKPREHNLLTAPIAETVFEPRVGGFIYDRGVDGSICRWARVLVFDPPHRVVFSWDIGSRWQLESDRPIPARWRSGSLPTAPTGPGLNLSTATSTGMAQDGKVCVTASPATTDGPCTWLDMPDSSPQPRRGGRAYVSNQPRWPCRAARSGLKMGWWPSGNAVVSMVP